MPGLWLGFDAELYEPWAGMASVHEGGEGLAWTGRHSNQFRDS